MPSVESLSLAIARLFMKSKDSIEITDSIEWIVDI